MLANRDPGTGGHGPNALPVLEVDGHIALTDYLDEPDLSPRSREALVRKLRGIKHTEQPSWLPAFGAFSLLGGVVLLAGGAWIWWTAVADLVTSLLGGTAVEVLLGLYFVVPFALGMLFLHDRPSSGTDHPPVIGGEEGLRDRRNA